MTPNFKRCTDLATDLLYSQNTSETMIDVQKLKYNKKIVFDSIQEYARTTNTSIESYQVNGILKNGCCVYHDKFDIYIVLYNDEIKNAATRNWTLAHEIGHIYLGHTHDGEIQEVEAHYFAAQLLMPEFTLNYMRCKNKFLTVEDVCNLFFVSRTAAQKRILAMNKKNIIHAGYKHKAICTRQHEKIELYYSFSNKNMWRLIHC